VDEETGDLVETMEHHRIPPHGYCDCVVAICQTIRADEQSFRLWKEPDCAHAQEVDEITQICKEVMVPSPIVRIVSNRHEVEELQRVPVVEVLRVATDQISTDQNI
jgi:hypothetical protein